MNPLILSITKHPIEAKQQALQSIQKGEIILFPTETVYGLGVDSACPQAIQRLYEVKGRSQEKPFQWLIHDSAIARTQSQMWDSRAETLARAFWPGPLTLVTLTQNGTIGWRVPRHQWLLDLLKELGRPLVATSANLSDQPAWKDFAPAVRCFAHAISFAADGGSLEYGVASTVVTLEKENIRILRKGAISEKEILQKAGRII